MTEKDSKSSMTVGKYSLVFTSLVALSGLTFGLSFADLGAWEWPAALGIAALKTALVAAFFMHLIELSPAHSLTGLVAVLMLTILILFALAEVWTGGRDPSASRRTDRISIGFSSSAPLLHPCCTAENSELHGAKLRVASFS